jgi:hypothetical protein
LRNRRHSRRAWIIVSKRSSLGDVAAIPIVQEHALFQKNFGDGNLLVLWVAPGADPD